MSAVVVKYEYKKLRPTWYSEDNSANNVNYLEYFQNPFKLTLKSSTSEQDQDGTFSQVIRAGLFRHTNLNPTGEREYPRIKSNFKFDITSGRGTCLTTASEGF